MSRARFATSIFLTAIITAALVSTLTLSRPARAASAQAECKLFMMGDLSPRVAQEWMEDQMGAGRSRFLAMGNGTLCAW